MRGVYKITNIINDKVYIGESLDIVRRWCEHRAKLKSNSHENKLLQSEYNLYGEQSFEFEIVSVLDDSISSFIDKYALLIFENIYMEKNVNMGKKLYNAENTLKMIENGSKKIYNHKDWGILKSVRNLINENVIKDEGGIIFTFLYKMKDVEDNLNVNRYVLKRILKETNTILDDKKELIFNNNTLPQDFIIENGSYSKLRFTNQALEIIINIVKEYLICQDISQVKKERVEKKKVKGIDNTKIDETNLENLIISKYISIPNEESHRYKTIKQFSAMYFLNVKYIDLFRMLRELGVLEYKMLNSQKVNVPTSSYIDKFYISEYKNENKQSFIKLYINDCFEQQLERILLREDVIKLKDDI